MALKLKAICSESPRRYASALPVPLLAKLRSPEQFMPHKTTNTTGGISASLQVEAARSSAVVSSKSLGSLDHGHPEMMLMMNNMGAQRAEMFKCLEGWATHNLLPLLKPVKECWQPQDLLPDPTSEGFHDQLKEIRARTNDIPDQYFVVLVGDMITEEALPTYHSCLNGTHVFHDQSGFDDTPWATWVRGWTAEENRHGDLLNNYLYLSGRVDMKQIQRTIQFLIAAGMDIGTGNDPYRLIIYTSFQERATCISHGNTARLAMQHGDAKLAQICGTIASDEKRHERAYTKIAEKLFELDPNDMVLAFADMMRKNISMPAHFMYDGQNNDLFQHFSTVATRLGVYTPTDYREILEHLVAVWNVENLTQLSSHGRKAQDYVCGLAQRFKRLEERAQAKAHETTPIPFSWIFGRKV